MDRNETEKMIVNMVKENGSHVCEEIICHHCGHSEIAVHPFVESIECGGCGRRNASAVPIYPEFHGSSEPI